MRGIKCQFSVDDVGGVGGVAVAIIYRGMLAHLLAGIKIGVLSQVNSLAPLICGG